jgi:hypothetical protein
VVVALAIERQIELVLLSDVEPQHRMERVEGPPDIHEVFRVWPLERDGGHEPLEHPREVKDLQVRPASSRPADHE